MPHLIALLVVIIWGTTFVSSKVLLNSGLAPSDIFFYRFTMAYAIILCFCHKRFFASNIKDELTLAGLGLMGGSLYFLTENMALTYSTSANVSILVCTTPLLTALLLAIFYKSERLNTRQVFGSIVAFLGMILVVLNGQLMLHLNPLGDTLAICAAMTWAFYSLFMRRIMNKYPTEFITRKVFFYGLVTIMPYICFIHPLNTDTTLLTQPKILSNLLFLGIIASSLSYALWNWTMRQLGAVKSSNYLYLQTIVTMIVAHLVLGERITLMAISGAMILIFGMVLIVKRKKK